MTKVEWVTLAAIILISAALSLSILSCRRNLIRYFDQEKLNEINQMPEGAEVVLLVSSDYEKKELQMYIDNGFVAIEVTPVPTKKYKSHTVQYKLIKKTKLKNR